MKSFLLVACGLLALLALTRAETSCESHRRNGGTSIHGLTWNIQCDGDGYYLPLQCTDEPKEEKRWCACYNKENAVTNPSKKMRHCQCPLKRSEANDANAADCDIPKCDSTGKWEKKQCCPGTRTCHCVNPENGSRTTDPSNDANLECP